MSNTKVPTGLTSALSPKCLSGYVYSGVGISVLHFCCFFSVSHHLQPCIRDSTLRCSNSHFTAAAAALGSPEPNTKLARVSAAPAPAIPRLSGGCQHRRALPYVGPSSAGLGALAARRGERWRWTLAHCSLLLQGTVEQQPIAGCEPLWQFGCSHCLPCTGALFLFGRCSEGDHLLESM